MSSVEIASDASEPIRVEYLIDGEPVLSSITVKADVRRVGGQVLDWSDATFKAIGSVVQRYVTLAEDGASYPGRYSYTWDTSTITNAAASDVYQVMIYDDSEIIGMGEIRVGTVTTINTIAAGVTSVLAFGAPPSAVAIGAAVWATAHGTPSVNTFGWLTWRHAQWGTEIADKAIVGQDLVLRSPDLVTTYATVRLRDKDGNVIAPAVGEPARFDP